MSAEPLPTPEVQPPGTSGVGSFLLAALETTPASAPASPTLSLRILIAEDSAVNQLVLAGQLDSLGHTSGTVTNGRDALAALEQATWDAILLDCQMPIMDGYETVAAIRSREAAGARRVWVVAVTASDLAGEREACFRAGMDDFLSKPFQVGQLEEVIARIPRAGDDAAPPVDAVRIEGLANAKASTGENLLEKMVFLFIESGQEMIGQMEAALAGEDFVGAVRAAHKLAGGCMYFGAKELHSLCAEAQRLGRAGDDAAVRAIVPRIRQEYQRVVLALRRARPTL